MKRSRLSVDVTKNKTVALPNLNSYRTQVEDKYGILAVKKMISLIERNRKLVDTYQSHFPNEAIL